MKAATIMEKSIGACEARRQFGKLLTGIVSGGDRYIIERYGEPVAVLVPLELYEQWQRGRGRFVNHIEATAKRTDMESEEADELVREVTREERRNMFDQALAASKRNPDLEDTAVLTELEQLDAKRPPTVASRESGGALEASGRSSRLGKLQVQLRQSTVPGSSSLVGSLTSGGQHKPHVRAGRATR